MLKKIKPIFIIFIASTFYLYDFFLRVSPSVLTHELMAHYNVGADVLGTIVASFFLAYTLMQIPSGLLGDKFGPRLVLSISCLLCVISTLLFTLSNSIYIGMLSRLLIGGSAAFAYIAPLMLASRWFAAKHFALICGLIQMMGCLGAIVGGMPVAYFTNIYGWEATLNFAAYIGIALTIIYFSFIENAPKNKKCPEVASLASEKTKIINAMKIVCKNPQTWVIGIIGFAAWAPVSIFAELWGVPFLEKIYSVNAITAANFMRYTWIGIALGGPTLGWISSKINLRKAPLILSLLTSLICCYFIIYTILPILLLKLTLFLFGFSAACQCLTFGAIRDIHPLKVAGTAAGFNNMGVILGGIICQPIVGVILEKYWQGHLNQGAHIFTPHAYQMAFLLIPLCIIIGLLAASIAFKETYGKQQYKTKTLK